MTHVVPAARYAGRTYRLAASTHAAARVGMVEPAATILARLTSAWSDPWSVVTLADATRDPVLPDRITFSVLDAADPDRPSGWQWFVSTWELVDPEPAAPTTEEPTP